VLLEELEESRAFGMPRAVDPHGRRAARACCCGHCRSRRRGESRAVRGRNGSRRKGDAGRTVPSPNISGSGTTGGSGIQFTRSSVDRDIDRRFAPGPDALFVSASAAAGRAKDRGESRSRRDANSPAAVDRFHRPPPAVACLQSVADRD
jgi:hypothetical protein